MESHEALSLKDIFAIKRSGENNRIEFKTTPFLRDNDEIAAQLTSFANRFGGRILIGVKDEKDLQGWDALEGSKIDRDRSLIHISNIAMKKCSPRVDFSSDFLESDKGDVLVLNIKKRKGMPHAIVERADHEIKKRIYYIRTESGKRLADDRMLSYMFSNVEDPYLEHAFTIAMQYVRGNLQFPAAILAYHCVWHLLPFMQQLREQDIRFLKEEESNRIRLLFVDLLPYAMLGFLSQYFANSWLVKIEKMGGSMTISPSDDVEKEEIEMQEIPAPPENSLLSRLSLDTKSILSSQFFRLMLPPETKVEMVLPQETQYTSELQLTRHNSFELDFSFRGGHWMVGAGAVTPLYGVLDKFEEYRSLQDAIATTMIKASITCKFAFPDVDDPLFEKIYKWGQTIVQIVKDDWDWDAFVGKLPDSRVFSIETRLERILEILESEKSGKKD